MPYEDSFSGATVKNVDGDHALFPMKLWLFRFVAHPGHESFSSIDGGIVPSLAGHVQKALVFQSSVVIIPSNHCCIIMRPASSHSILRIGALTASSTQTPEVWKTVGNRGAASYLE